MCIAGAIATSVATAWIDRRIDAGATTPLLFTGSAEGAQSFLSTIASAMLTFTGLVFTITMVVLQLASGQFSPRVMRTYLRDRQSQIALGVFVGTFTYALLVLRIVRIDTASADAFVPALSVTCAFVFVLLSIILFIRYAHHIAQSIRVINVIASVAAETRAALDALYPKPVGSPAAPSAWRPDDDPEEILTSPTAGVLTGVDDEGIIAVAEERGVVLELLHPIGRFVPEGSPLVAVHGRPATDSHREILSLIRIGQERTMQQDAEFGFRQLVDIGARALSPGVNDPTTAAQVLDQLHDLLYRLARKDIPSPVRTGTAGIPRAVLPRPGWEDYVALAVEEIRGYGEGSIQVARRLRRMLVELLEIAPEGRREPVRRQLEALESGIRRGLEEATDRRSARRPDDDVEA